MRVSRSEYWSAVPRATEPRTRKERMRGSPSMASSSRSRTAACGATTRGRLLIHVRGSGGRTCDCSVTSGLQRRRNERGARRRGAVKGSEAAYTAANLAGGERHQRVPTGEDAAGAEGLEPPTP